MTTVERTEAVKVIKEQLRGDTDKWVESMTSTMLPALINMHNGSVDDCIALVDVLLMRPDLITRETIQELREVMLKLKE